MTSTDPISDMLTRIRNAILVSKTFVSLPHSNIKQAVAEVLKSSGYLSEVSVEGEKTNKTLKVVINEEQANPNITEIARLSRPGRRLYVSSSEIPVVKNGRGIVVVSTSKGVMSGDAAKKARVGGELICEVY